VKKSNDDRALPDSGEKVLEVCDIQTRYQKDTLKKASLSTKKADLRAGVDQNYPR